MIRAAFFVACFLLFLQCYPQLWQHSRSFPTSKKNIPLAIINNDVRHFFVLRYNKEAHDIIVERRKKPAAEIISISPLRMDSVNASWFDYLNLDYLFFEINNRVFYVFEKVLNAERTLYLKFVDSSGRTGPFIPLQQLVNDKNTTELKFEYLVTAEKQLLIVSSRRFWNGSVKKQATLYDPIQLKILWQKQLPVENPFTGYSAGFQCNPEGDLFYFLIQSSVVSHRRIYRHQQQMMEPVLFYNKIDVKSYLRDNKMYSYTIPMKEVWGLYGASVYPMNGKVTLHLHYYSTDHSGNPRVYLYNAMASALWDEFGYERVTPLSAKIDSMLTYYDGTDEKSAATKQFFLRTSQTNGSRRTFLAERQDDNYKKEGFFYEVDLRTGEVTKQHLLPRKNLNFEGFSRFRNLGDFATGSCGGLDYFGVLENKRNDRLRPEAYKYNEFRKQRELGGSFATYYSDSFSLKKTILTRKEDFDYIPISYTGLPCEYILYLNKNRLEKFVILNLEKLQ